jgi:cellulose synthase (UDP-forming)
MSVSADDDRYYLAFEDRFPPEPPRWPAWRMTLWQVLATMAMALGAWYLHWRWTQSINWEVWWFSLPLVVAETLAFIGALLSTFNLWDVGDTPMQPAPHKLAEITDDPDVPDRPLSVDVFFPTYSEDPELVRLSIQDGKRLTYPHPIDVRLWVLDDGRRPAMRAVAEEEGIGYITRNHNVGFKAGNLHNAVEQTSADFIVICDADTRPLPTLLEETLGYFRDPKVAWVQSPQWFYDIPEGVPLPEVLGAKLGGAGRAIGRGVEKLVGPVRFGADPFGNEATMFFDVIQRRRNRVNASFCCGAASVHRRETVMAAALKEFAEDVHGFVDAQTKDVTAPDLADPLRAVMLEEAARDLPVMPYKYHVSEDIFTSLVLHADREQGWKSVYHPRPLSRMLSPQDLLTWTLQRFKYAGGTLDIAKTHNPLTLPGLTIAQRLMYMATVYSYFAWVWVIVFLAAPIIYFFTGLIPVSSYGPAFFMHALPFLFVNRLAYMVGTWGVESGRGEEYYIDSFHLQMRAFWTVLKGETIKFPVTPKVRQAGSYGGLVRPHLVLLGLTVLGMAVHGLGIALGYWHDLDAYVLNLFWGGYNVATLAVIVKAAYWQPPAREAAGAAMATARS